MASIRKVLVDPQILKATAIEFQQLVYKSKKLDMRARIRVQPEELAAMFSAVIQAYIQKNEVHV